MHSERGRLILLPTTLGETTDPLQVLPLRIREEILRLDIYIVENEKTARRRIKTLAPEKSQPALKFYQLNKHTAPEEIPDFLSACREGKDIGLMSEAGCPGVADPGAEVVRLAHEQNIQVIPLVGPSSILLALMASGMNGQSFAFHGYLPIDKNERRNQIKFLEKTSGEKGQAQIFIETPYRNNRLLEELVRTLHPSCRLCIAWDLTLPTENIVSKPVARWNLSEFDLHKKPAIFILQKES